MPDHQIYHAKGAFTAEEKREMAKRITDLYQSYGLPRFYVNVRFIQLDDDSFLIGGKFNKKFIRLELTHGARQMEKPREVNDYFEKYEKLLAPFIKEKGYDWEISIQEVDRDLWRVNGMVPPWPNTKADDLWKKLDKAVPYYEKDNVRA